MNNEHTEPNYIAIWAWLAALTAVEIGVTFLPVGKLAIGFMLVALAVVKALLVALYFMHLRYERATLGLIALTPLVLCTFLVLMLLPDMVG